MKYSLFLCSILLITPHAFGGDHFVPKMKFKKSIAKFFAPTKKNNTKPTEPKAPEKLPENFAEKEIIQESKYDPRETEQLQIFLNGIIAEYKKTKQRPDPA